MGEAGKTFTFLGVAFLVLIAAFLSRPTTPPASVEELAGGKDLNVLEDPLAAEELEILRWDAATGEPIEFRVARPDGVWKIPSHGEYPADADRQMGEAATAATNLKPLGIVTSQAKDHETYGVVDPETAKPGQSGVGTRVTIKNGKGEALVNTIIGKEVKDRAGQRYVRQVGKDIVYIVKIDPSKLSTKFEDWIEKDLLKLNTLDISRIKINDYSVNIAQTQGGLGLVDDRRGEILLAYNDAENTWSLDQLLKWDETEQKLVPDSIPPGEELNDSKLNEMKNALGDLKIIDVQRKPAGMSADLKAEQDFVTNQQAVQNLMSRGFYAVRGPNDSIEILSSEGDFVVGLKDGVEYMLRFGGIKVGSSGAEEEKSESNEEVKGENRFLFVAARYNPDVIPVPEKPAILTDEVPEDGESKSEAPATEEGEKPSSDGATEGSQEEADAASKPETSNESETPAESDPPPAKTPDASTEKEESASRVLTPDEEDGAAVDPPTPTDSAEEAKPESEAPAEPKTDPNASEPAEKTAESSADAAAEQKTPAGEAEAPESNESPEKKESTEKAEPAPEQSAEELAKAREAAELQYKRAMDEYNEKVEKAQTQVKELNDRFGDWYYVISDEVFQKIHLTRADLFKPAEAEKKEAAETENEVPPTSIPLEVPGSIKE